MSIVAEPIRPTFLTIAGAVQRSSLSEVTVRRMVRLGQLQAHRVGRRLLVEAEQLDRVIRGGNDTPPAA